VGGHSRHPVEVAAGAEGSTRAGEEDGPRVALHLQLLEQAAKLVVHLAVDRVQLVARVGQRHFEDVADALELHRAVAAESTHLSWLSIPCRLLWLPTDESVNYHEWKVRLAIFAPGRPWPYSPASASPWASSAPPCLLAYRPAWSSSGSLRSPPASRSRRCVELCRS